jgi:hypothetical protein
MATFNSRLGRAILPGLAAVFILFLTPAGPLLADTTTNAVFAARAEKAFQTARVRFQADTNNPTNGWMFGRACYDWADFAKNNTARADIANQGIAACRQCLARTSNSAPGHYYLAMDMGQLARTELLGALRLVDQMEVEFKIAIGLDENFDYAGPARNLGLLYWQAPSIGSIGDRGKARHFLECAVQLAPDYPENHLNLIEALLDWRDTGHARTELTALDQLWPQALKTFTGPAWEQSWADWTERRVAARRKLADISRRSGTAVMELSQDFSLQRERS